MIKKKYKHGFYKGLNVYVRKLEIRCGAIGCNN